MGREDPHVDQEMERMINFITSDAIDKDSKQPEFKIAAVKIEKADNPKDITEQYIISDINSPFE